MDDSLSFSLEQDFNLRVLADQIQQSNSINELQGDLVELFKQTWKIQQEMKSLMGEDEPSYQDPDLELTNRLTIYKKTISIISNIEDLKDLVIEAHKMLVVQNNYAEILRSEFSEPAWVRFGY